MSANESQGRDALEQSTSLAGQNTSTPSLEPTAESVPTDTVNIREQNVSSSSRSGTESIGTYHSPVFACHICLETAHNAVATLCSHIYCMTCICRWLGMPGSRALCPVCQSAVKIRDIIWLRGAQTTNQADQQQSPEFDAGVPPFINDYELRQRRLEGFLWWAYCMALACLLICHLLEILLQ